MISLDTKAYYYEKLFRMMTTPPKKSDDIHGVYSSGTVKVSTLNVYPTIYLRWDIMRGKMQYHLLVVLGEYDRIVLGAELHFKKTPQTQTWVNKRRSSEIYDVGDHYEWKAKKSEASDWFYDTRLQSKYCEIPGDLLNMAAGTIRDKFSYFCGSGFGNPYFELYTILE